MENVYPTLPKTQKVNRIVWKDVNLVDDIQNAVVDTVVDAVVENFVPLALSLDDLPAHPEDFAEHWRQNISPEKANRMLEEYQLYLQVLNELGNGVLELPDADGIAIAMDIRYKIIEEMEKQDIIINLKENKTHRAFFAHCAKRILDTIQDGIFLGEDGFEGERPDIAEVIQNRIKQLKTEKIFSNL